VFLSVVPPQSSRQCLSQLAVTSWCSSGKDARAAFTFACWKRFWRLEVWLAWRVLGASSCQQACICILYDTGSLVPEAPSLLAFARLARG